jgi:hypothetical protein
MAVISGAVTGVMGAVHDGKIYLFRDLLRSKAEEARTLFHKLLRYGPGRLLIEEQFISHILRSYERDGAIRAEADG